MGKINRFEDLPVWKAAVEIAVIIHKTVSGSSIKNDFRIKDQILASAFSISSNIAEGFEYNSNKEFVRFLRYAKGSCGELRSQLFILKEISDLNEDLYNKLYQDLVGLSSQISGLIKYLKNHIEKNN
jgi:four helix bundle protein